VIPAIDLSRGARALAGEVRRAYEEVGFLTVTGHRVPEASIARCSGGV
jgi:hypothetical protein